MVFSKRKHELEPVTWCPQCRIYWNANRIAVAALHGDAVGSWSVEGDPMVLLHRSASASNVGEAVVRSLRASRSGLTPEEAESTWRAFPQFIGEFTWKAVETGWELICVSEKPGANVVIVYPMHRFEDGGWGCEQHDPEYESTPDPEEIGKLVLRIIGEGPPQVRPG